MGIFDIELPKIRNRFARIEKKLFNVSEDGKTINSSLTASVGISSSLGLFNNLISNNVGTATADNFIIKTNNQERVTIDKDGYFTTNLKFLPSKGLDFSTTTNGSLATNVSEILSDYETGYFSPRLSGSTTQGDCTYSNDSIGSYTKIGNIVYVTGRVFVTAITTNPAGELRIINLPFVSKNIPDTIQERYSGVISFNNNLGSTSTRGPYYAYMFGGENYFRIKYEWNFINYIQGSDVVANTDFVFSFIYQTDQ